MAPGKITHHENACVVLGVLSVLSDVYQLTRICVNGLADELSGMTKMVLSADMQYIVVPCILIDLMFVILMIHGIRNVSE